jgi:hypothetical protein
LARRKNHLSVDIQIWGTIAMVERYSKSLTFDDALQFYKQVNVGGDWGFIGGSPVYLASNYQAAFGN